MNLGDLLDRQGPPDHAALIGVGDDGSEHVMTRAQLDAQADAFARGLLARGVAPGERIALLSANRCEYVAAMLGAMRAGVVPVPVNHKFPQALIDYVLRDSGARLVLCDEARKALLPPLAQGVEVAGFDEPAPSGFGAWLDPGPLTCFAPAPDDVALILYTSGSTGKPKGVMLSHAAHLWVARTRMNGRRTPGERYLIAAPLYHMNALALMFLVCISGATAILLPQFQARRYIEAITRYRPTWLTAVPPMIAMMLREEQALTEADFSSVRAVRMGSAPVSDNLVASIKALLVNARIVNAYGTTEGGPVVFDSHPEGLVTPTASVGYPHPAVQVRLSGGATDDQGVLEMKSPGIMLGYHARPDLTPPITDDGFYRTGDVFRKDVDGFYYFVGRADDMFVSGGENIFPGEVEAVLDTHPDIVQSCVVPVDDEIKGTKPVAFVVCREGAQLDEGAVRQYVLDNAAAYQHPRHVWFLDAMLLASTNKVDRAALKRIAQERVAGLQS